MKGREQNHFPVSEFLESGCILSGWNEEIWVGWGLRKDGSPKQTGLRVYAPDFFLERVDPWYSVKSFVRISRNDLLLAIKEYLSTGPSALNAEDPDSVGINPQWVRPDFEFFRETLHDLKNRFYQGILKKAVPYLFEEAPFQIDAIHRALLLYRLIKKTLGLQVYIYGIWENGTGILGASPELLVQRRLDEDYFLPALAGTRIHGSQQRPLLDDEKEIREHQLVVEGILNSLRDLGATRVGTTQELTLPTFSHLFTPIYLKSQGAKAMIDSSYFLEQIVRRLHPTPALGAYPKDMGMLWLKDYQKKVPRFRYGAPFGIFLSGGEGRCIISIRGIQWAAERAFIGAGCGIIEASELFREWNELIAKIESVKLVFGGL